MKYQQCKGRRIKKRFHGMQVEGYWWLCDSKEWISIDLLNIISPGEWCTNTLKCNSVRAFRRRLRKYPWLKGRARLVSKFVGYDVWG